MRSICGFERRATLITDLVPLILPRTVLFWCFALLTIPSKSLSRFIVLVSLLCSICYILSMMWCGRPNSWSHECMFSVTFCVGFVHILLRVRFFLFTKLFQCFPILFFSLSSCLSSIAVSSIILYNSDSLSALSLQLLVHVFDLSFKADPAHLSQQRSLSICLELFHLSCEL